MTLRFRANVFVNKKSNKELSAEMVLLATSYKQANNLGSNQIKIIILSHNKSSLRKIKH